MPQAANYEQAIESLYALGHELAEKPGQPRRKWELAHMRTLCAALGDPQLAFPAVLIAGTNGKGSTAATLAAILQAAGHRTALYTSPHLVRVNERIQINGVEISGDDFARLYFHVDDTAQKLIREGTLPHPPSFFEVMTALAFTWFAEQHIDIAVLEVGLGGRLDATNIIEPLLSVIADISLDHTEYLGSTLTEIAHEKAGILRENGILVTLPQHPLANQAIGERAVALNVTGINAAEYMPMRNSSVIPTEASRTLRCAVEGPAFRNRYPLTVLGEQIEIDSPLAGNHQQRNIALAIAAAVTLKEKNNYAITAKNIAEGIRNTRWPGRLEYFEQKNIETKTAPFLLDVAHNPAGVWALRSVLAHLPDNQPKTLIFSCLRDKALTEMAQILFPIFGNPGDQILVPPIANPRAASVEEILTVAKALDIHAQAVENVAKAVKNAQLTTPKNGIIIATGSVYLIGAVRAELMGSGETK